MLAGTEAGSLFHTETVLFIRDGKGEAGEAQAIAEQGVGSDDQVKAAGFKGFDKLPLFFCPRGAGQQADPDPKRTEKVSQRPAVLFGKDLGRRHEGGGIPDPEALPYKRSGNQRFAAAHVALQEPAHLPAGCHVRSRFFYGTALGTGRREGERFQERCKIGLRNNDSRTLCFPAAAESTGEEKQLFEYKAFSGPVQGIDILRKVNAFVGIFRPNQTVFRPNGIGEKLRNPTVAAVQALADALPQCVLRKTADKAINRDNFTGDGHFA